MPWKNWRQRRRSWTLLGKSAVSFSAKRDDYALPLFPTDWGTLSRWGFLCSISPWQIPKRKLPPLGFNFAARATITIEGDYPCKCSGKRKMKIRKVMFSYTGTPRESFRSGKPHCSCSGLGATTFPNKINFFCPPFEKIV